mgnify:CR=1 FL=1
MEAKVCCASDSACAVGLRRFLCTGLPWQAARADKRGRDTPPERCCAPAVQRRKLPSPAFLPSTDPARRGCTGGSGLYNKQTEMVVQYWIYSARGDSDTFVVDLYFAATVPCARALYVWACMADGGCRSFAQFAGQTNSAALLPTLLEPGLHGSTGRGRRL